jgi:hypothetical protein
MRKITSLIRPSCNLSPFIICSVPVSINIHPWGADGATRRWGRHRLAGWMINGGSGGEVRVKVSSYRGGAVPMKLEGARRRRSGDGGVASVVDSWRAGLEGGGLPEMGGEEVNGGEENQKWHRRTQGRRQRGLECATGVAQSKKRLSKSKFFSEYVCSS